MLPFALGKLSSFGRYGTARASTTENSQNTKKQGKISQQNHSESIKKRNNQSKCRRTNARQHHFSHHRNHPNFSIPIDTFPQKNRYVSVPPRRTGITG
ncbi:hypothetical protein ADIS_2816 [Lunatimonas lonarensis]|uniref:Uncharacterized protein n=1 Tax=Lunatimonas lonarensis TaxID=1232681 RepID=R7ZRN3_9BACT|nr:hypothetical protein ADIS_2816 [Lunatimonas lonarensis]